MRDSFVHVGFNVNLLARNLLACGMVALALPLSTARGLRTL